jgi:hypothetical protein
LKYEVWKGIFMMVKGYVVNNTGRSKHIFKRTVYPGQKVELDYIFKLVGAKVPDGAKFVDWLRDTYLPKDWEVDAEVEPELAAIDVDGRQFKETLTAVPVVATATETTENGMSREVAVVAPDNSPSKEYMTPKAIGDMKAKDIYELQLKDNPKRILKNVNSIHKLRRALTLCKRDSRKETLQRLIQGRIRQLNITL